MNLVKCLEVYSNSVISKIAKFYLASNEYCKFNNNIGLHIYMSSYDIKAVESKVPVWKHSPGGAFYVYYYYTYSPGRTVYYYDPQSEQWLCVLV